MDSLGLTWDSFGLTSTHFDSRGLTCNHLTSLELTWLHLDSIEGKREKLPREKGRWKRHTHWEGRAGESGEWRGEGRATESTTAGPSFASSPHRATNEAKRFPSWTHTPTSDNVYGSWRIADVPLEGMSRMNARTRQPAGGHGGWCSSHYTHACLLAPS